MSKIVPLVGRHRESGWWKPIRKAFGNGFVRFEADHRKFLHAGNKFGATKLASAGFRQHFFISRLIRVLTLQG